MMPARRIKLMYEYKKIITNIRNLHIRYIPYWHETSYDDRSYETLRDYIALVILSPTISNSLAMSKKYLFLVACIITMIYVPLGGGIHVSFMLMYLIYALSSAFLYSTFLQSLSSSSSSSSSSSAFSNHSTNTLHFSLRASIVSP